MSSRDLAIFVTNDLTGISRGRAFPAADVSDRRKSGVGWVPTNLALTPFSKIGENPIGPLGDLRLKPDADDEGFRLTGCRDGEPDLRAFLCDIVETDGRPWAECGRGILKRALVDLEPEAGLAIKAAFQHEFMMQDIPPPANQGFTLIDIHGAQNFICASQEALGLVGSEPEMLLRQYGPNQFGFTVRPAVDVVAADRAVMLRDITRNVARQFRSLYFGVVPGAGICGCPRSGASPPSCHGALWCFGHTRRATGSRSTT